MKFLARYLKTEQAEMDQNNVRLRAIGQLDRLPGFVREQLDATIASLDANTGTTPVALDAGQSALTGPAAVAVHDDGDVRREGGSGFLAELCRCAAHAPGQAAGFTG